VDLPWTSSLFREGRSLGSFHLSHFGVIGSFRALLRENLFFQSWFGWSLVRGSTTMYVGLWRSRGYGADIAAHNVWCWVLLSLKMARLDHMESLIGYLALKRILMSMTNEVDGVTDGRTGSQLDELGSFTARFHPG
jgi:hypothetical protein